MMLTYQDVAASLGCSVQSLKTKRSKGEMPVVDAFETGRGRPRPLWKSETIDEWVAARLDVHIPCRVCGKDVRTKSVMRSPITICWNKPDCVKTENRRISAAHSRSTHGRAMQMAWRKANPDAQRAISRRSTLGKMGFSHESFDQMLLAQGGGCAICLRKEPPGTTQWALDHDHGCCPGVRSCGKCVRGILCGPCNSGLGMFRDNVDIVVNAGVYLERFASTASFLVSIGA